MAGNEEVDKKIRSTVSSCEAYFEKVQSRKNLPKSLQETLNSAFAGIPVSSFPQVPGGRGKLKDPIFHNMSIYVCSNMSMFVVLHFFSYKF